MSPTKETDVPMAETENRPRERSYRDAKVEFSAQPANELRFRYFSEFSKGSHGSLKSQSFKKGSRNVSGYPTVRIHRCRTNYYLQVKLYTADKLQPHAHKLIDGSKFEGAKGCVFFEGTPPNEKGYSEIELINLNILHVGKEKLEKFVNESVTATMRETGDFPDNFARYPERCREFKKLIENSAVLRVDLIVDKKIVSTAFSSEISNTKTQLAKQVNIIRISKVTGVCSGGEEVLVFTNKLRPEDINKTAIGQSDIEVVFFQRTIEGEVVWERNGELTYNHQLVGLVFKTPPYRDETVDNPVDVIIQLRRKNDPDSWSDEFPFRYVPSEESDVRRKRAKTMATYPAQVETGQLAARKEQIVVPPVAMEVTHAACSAVEIAGQPLNQAGSSEPVLNVDDIYCPEVGNGAGPAIDNYQDRSVGPSSKSPKKPESVQSGSKRKTKLLAITIAKLRKRISYDV